MDKYKIFFEKLNIIFSKYHLAHSNADGFNIFAILRNESDEVNLHSRFIAELLNNKIFGKRMLKKFLEIMEIESQFFGYDVKFEYDVKNNGRIDILIKLNSVGAKRVIVIENKIYAEDQYEQLKRYYDAMIIEGYKDNEIEIVYLTLFGKEPSEDSVKGLSKSIRCISYKEEILSWITEYIKESSTVPVIRETCVQYKELLKKLTSVEDEDLNDKLKTLILENDEYLDILFGLPNVLENIKIDLQFKFWNKLEELLSLELNNKKIIQEKELLFPNSYYSKEKIKQFYRNKQNNKYYGLMYFIKEIPDRGKLYLRIEVDHNLYYGFRIIDAFNNSDKNNIDNYLEEKLKELGFTRTNWWLGWKYIRYKGNILNFRELNKEIATILKSDELIKDLIDDIVKNIVATLDEIEKEL